MQDRRLAPVAKTDAAQDDVAAGTLCGKALCPVDQIGLGVKHLEHAARADPGAGNHPPALTDLVNRRIELSEIGDEDNQLADGQGARHHRSRSGVHDKCGAGGNDAVDCPRIQGLPAVKAQGGA